MRCHRHIIWQVLLNQQLSMPPKEGSNPTLKVAKTSHGAVSAAPNPLSSQWSPEIIERMLFFFNEMADIDDRLLVLTAPCVSKRWRDACAKLPAKIKLSAAWAHSLTEDALASIAKQFPKVRILDLAGRDTVTDTGLAKLAACCTQLSTLNLKECIKVTDEGLGKLAACCTQLSTLILHGCRKVTDEGLGKLAAGCAQLTSLSLDGCSEVTDEGLGKLAAGCAQLTSLNLGGCRKVTAEGRSFFSFL